MKSKKKGVNLIDKWGWLICFGISVTCGYIVLWQLGHGVNGEDTILFGDLINIYIPAIKNLCRDMANGQSIYYSWNTSFGMNTSLYNAYYAYNPFNVLYLIFYNGDDNITTILIILVKIGMASSCFYSYVRRKHDATNTWNIVFAVFYSMCAFQVTSNLTNTIWLDALWILPLSFMSIDLLIKKGKIIYLIVVYTYIFTTEFYMGYMIAIVGSLYVILCTFTENRISNGIAYVKKFFVASIMAVGLSAWVWVPVICFLKYSIPVDATKLVNFRPSVLSFYRAFFCRGLSETYAMCPNIYCGTITTILSFYFFINRTVEKKEKFIYGILYVFLMLSCFLAPLYLLWHGFDNPDGWTYRFSYIISFIMCVVAVITVSNLKRNDLNRVAFLMALSICVYVADVAFFSRELCLTDIKINVVFLIAWFAVIYFEKSDKRGIQLFLNMIVVGLVIIEIVFAYNDQDFLRSDTDMKTYSLANLTEKETSEELKKDQGMYRVNYLNEIGFNSGTYYGYNGISHFSAAENPNVRAALSKLGIASSPRLVMNQGVADPAKMIFDIQYDVIGAVYRPNITNEDLYAKIIENDNVLGMGYMVSGNISDYYINSDNAFENNNKVLSLMTGETIEYFLPIDDDRIIIEEKGVSLSEHEGIYTIKVLSGNSETEDTYLDYYVDSDYNTYTYIYHKEPYFAQSGFLLTGGYENMRKCFGQLSLSYIKPLLYSLSENKPLLRIVPLKGSNEQSFERIYFAEIDESELEKAYDILKENQFIINEYSDGYLKGSVNVPNDKDVLFTSVPYDKGWKAYVDGKEQEIYPILNDAFSAIIIPKKGINNIVFKFDAVGAKTGVGISLFSLLGLVIYLSVMKCRGLRYSKRENNKNRIEMVF